MERDSEAIKDTLREYAASCNNGDFESWIALWEPQGCQMPPQAPSRVGVHAIRKAMQPAFEGMKLKLDLLTIDEVTVFGSLGLNAMYIFFDSHAKGGWRRHGIDARW